MDTSLAQRIGFNLVDRILKENGLEVTLATIDLKKIANELGLSLSDTYPIIQERLNDLLEKEFEKLKATAVAPRSKEEILNKPVTEFEFSVRARNCLRKMNIKNIRELVNYSESELLTYKSLRLSELENIKQKLAELGLKLKEE